MTQLSIYRGSAIYTLILSVYDLLREISVFCRFVSEPAERGLRRRRLQDAQLLRRALNINEWTRRTPAPRCRWISCCAPGIGTSTGARIRKARYVCFPPTGGSQPSLSESCRRTSPGWCTDDGTACVSTGALDVLPYRTAVPCSCHWRRRMVSRRNAR